MHNDLVGHVILNGQSMTPKSEYFVGRHSEEKMLAEHVDKNTNSFNMTRWIY